MSKIVFFGFPAHGHTNPTLGVVRELISRGHQVWYYSYQMLREKIEATGATFISCDEFDTQTKLNPKDANRIGKDLAFSTKLLVDTTLALDDKVSDEMQQLQPDCIVADSMALWGKAVAKKLKIPFVSSTTTFAFNQYSSKIMKRSLWDLLKMILSLSQISKQVKRLQNKGYPVTNILDIIGNDERLHTIVYTSAEFQPFSETFSKNYAFVGPCLRPTTSEIKKTKEKLIYISMGTVNNDMLPFYQDCISGFSNTDFQVILSVGNLIPPEKLITSNKNISVVTHIDQIAVLQKADVFISHCGMNSVNESLYFGVPLIMLPQTAEQNGVCERVLQLGAGIKLHQTSPTNILDSVHQILTDISYQKNARKISEGFQRCSGAKGAADKIIQVCNETM